MVYLETVYVMLSRAKSMNQIYLLHPLWTNPRERTAFLTKSRERFQYDNNTRNANAFLERLSAATERLHTELQNVCHMHPSRDPDHCAGCGARLP